MRSPRLATAFAVAALAVGGLAVALPGATASPIQPTQSKGLVHTMRLCPTHPRPGFAACQAEAVVFPHNAVLDGPPATALTPDGLQDAYNLKGLKSGGATIGIVDAYSYPNLEKDLGVFRSYFGLPACTTKNGCLTIMNQRGGSTPPTLFQLNWAEETALDVDAVSSACPDCKILVVQTDTNSFKNLGAGVITASKQKGVAAISNSYSGGDAKDTKYGKYYDHPGIAVTASTGDAGFQGAGYPAGSDYVVAVGGTTLGKATNARGWNESVWAGAGSGCSTKNKAIKGSKPYDTGCGKFRAVADVSAAASPGEGGLAWYGPASETVSHWGQVGGTSESSPIIAAVFGLSGNTQGDANQIPYQDSSHLYDITAGSNGTCSPSQLCTARKGWDGPTGLGTPNGVKSF